jgi:ribosome-associated protein
MEVSKTKKIIEKTLNQNKAKNIISISLKGKSSIADYMIIASGNSSKHIQSLSENLLKKLEEKGIGQCKIEGKTSKDWKLIDAIDIIVHISHPEKRKFYDLEKMWGDPSDKKEVMV